MSTSITFSKIINELRYLLSIYGLPKRLVTDYPLFVSQEFSSFTKLNKAKHMYIKTSPYHPTSQSHSKVCGDFKKAMTAKLNISLTTKFQVSYRIIPHSTANIITVSSVQAWATNDEHQVIHDPEQHILNSKQYITTHKERHINVSNPCQAVNNTWQTSEIHIEQRVIYNKHKQNTRSSEQCTNMNKTW